MTLRSLALAAVCTVVGAACSGVSGSPGPAGTPDSTDRTSTSATVAGTTPPPNGRPAELVTVFDGDTLLVRLDGAEEEVRLLGVNAPERGECFSTEARQAVDSLLADASLTIEVVGGRDQFGRLLGYAYAGSTLVNLALVEGGYALALQADHPRLIEFGAAEEEAFAAGNGLWAADACGPPTGVALSLPDIEPDPPGPDEDDLNGEWVLVANGGSETIDLTGWGLRDESSANRYRFPDGFSLAVGESVFVHTGCGDDGPGRLHWCATGPVWNNGGDTALLLDPTGNVAARLHYDG